jgi:histidine phosphotransfer protein HptB
MDTIWYRQTRQKSRQFKRQQKTTFVDTINAEPAGKIPTTEHTHISQDENWPINIDFVRSNLGSLMDELMPELIEVFFEDSISRMGQLKHSLSSHDEQQIRQTAHSLKGSSATLGMLSFSSLCAQLEMVAKVEDWENIPALVSQVGLEFNQIQSALTAS